MNLEEVIEQIEEKEKARIFFEYMQYLFGPEQDLSKIKNKAAVKFIKKHQWFLNHPKWHVLYFRTIKLYELIIIRYIQRISRSFTNKKDRIYILNRIKDPKWYKRHFKGVNELFK